MSGFERHSVHLGGLGGEPIEKLLLVEFDRADGFLILFAAQAGS